MADNKTIVCVHNFRVPYCERLNRVLMTMPFALAFLCVGIPADAGSSLEAPPKAVPDDIAREVQRMSVLSYQLASTDLDAACEALEEYIAKLRLSLGEGHWLVTSERAYLTDLQRFRNADPSTQKQAKEAFQVHFSALQALASRKYETALQLFTEQAMPVWRELSPDGVYYENAVHFSTVLRYHLQQFDTGKLWATQGTRLAKELYGENHLCYARAILLEGAIDLSLKDYEAAESRFLQAAEIFSKNCTKKHAMFGMPYAFLTVLHLQTGEAGKAIVFAQRTVDATNVHSLPNDTNPTALNFGVVVAVLGNARWHREAQIVLEYLLEFADSPVQGSTNSALASYYQLSANNLKFLNRLEESRLAQRQSNKFRAMVGKP